jgi:site-specific DNA recombinase
LPGEELESRVIIAIRNLLKDHHCVCNMINLQGREAHTVKQVIDHVVKITECISSPPVQEAQNFLKAILKRIDIEPGRLSITISTDGLQGALGIGKKNPVESLADHVLKLPFQFRRRGVEARLILGIEQQQSNVDALLIDTVSRAKNWLRRLTAEEDVTIAKLARQDGIDDGEISRVLPLAFLAPDIIESIVQGRQPATLTATYLRRLKPLSASWAEQKRILGFSIVHME